MANDLFTRYVWLMDTIRRYGRITREEVNRRWVDSPISNGRPIPRRSFHNYRIAVEELFNVNIECDPHTFEYYITQNDAHNDSVTGWLLNSTAMSNVLTGARDISDRIFIEDVPSAREYLHVVIDSLKANRTLRFTYHPYTRSIPNAGVTIEPYFLKIFRQRWYVTGRNIADNAVKTYALDRMSDVELTENEFRLPPDFNAEEYCSGSFGIIFDMGEVKDVVLKVESRQAKYFRALPLHSSQQEMIHDRFSLFRYRVRLTHDFIEEILSHGPRVTVVSPPELKAIVVASLRESLANYRSNDQADEPSPGNIC